MPSPSTRDFSADFPIFLEHPELVYLDSTSTTQKPKSVIDGMAKYLASNYANIHRGAYFLSENSEALYDASKKAVAALIRAASPHEIVYSGNSTGAFNLLARSIARSGWLKHGDRVVLSILEHHANIVPWLMLAEDIGIEVVFAEVNLQTFDLDYADLEGKITPNTRIVSLTGGSNVTGSVFDFSRISKIVRGKPMDRKDPPFETPLLVMDASQAVPHYRLDVQAFDLDFAIFTGHKIFADSGIGVLYGKKHLLKTMAPGIWGGGAINFVQEGGYEPAGLPFRFEPGTPNVTGAVSLLLALKYLESIGGYATLEAHEKELVAYALGKFALHSDFIHLVGSNQSDRRLGVFSFTVDGWHAQDVAEELAGSNICVRAGHHCAEILHSRLGLSGTVRASFSIYTKKEDIDRLFEKLLELKQ